MSVPVDGTLFFFLGIASKFNLDDERFIMPFVDRTHRFWRNICLVMKKRRKKSSTKVKIPLHSGELLFYTKVVNPNNRMEVSLNAS